MALEPGGYADKVGNRYEDLWVARQLLRVLNEELSSVTVEAVGEDEVGTDLWIVQKNGVRQAQQCKVRNVSRDHWSLSDLANRGILRGIQTQLARDPTYEFALVTAISATIVHDICKSARNSAGDSENFYANQIQAIGEDRRQAFRAFCDYLDLDSDSTDDRYTAFTYLQRIFIEHWPDTNTSRRDLNGLAQVLVTGDPATVISVLSGLAHEMLRKPIDTPLVWGYLESRGLHPRKLSSDDRVMPAIQALQRQFRESIGSDLIDDKLIARQEAVEVVNATKKHGVIVLHGSPGHGKSGVLLELTERLREEGIVFLPIRLDRQTPENNSRQFGVNLGLPESPVHCLDAIASAGAAVLILDQLDAIRWTSRHSMNALEVCRAILREVRHLRGGGKQISVVLACRSYDLRNDPEIKNWIATEKNNGNVAEVEIAPFPRETVTSVVQQVATVTLSERQLQILESPQHLAMWVRIVRSRGAFEFQNRVQLMREYWDDRLRELGRLGLSSADVEAAIQPVLDYMDRGSVAAPRSLLSNASVRDGLLHVGLLQESNGQVTFGHQSYLDYQIASRVVRQLHSAEQNVGAWLGGAEKQSLFRREQVRQALCLLSEESPSRFLDIIMEIIASEKVRFHLKHLCLEVIGELDSPSTSLLVYLKEISDHKVWEEHVVATTYVCHAPFITALIESKTMNVLLESEEKRNTALWILRSSPKPMADAVTAVLEPYVERGGDWLPQIHGCLSWNVEDDSDVMFELRLRLARQGVFAGYVNWDNLSLQRAWRLLEAIVSSWQPEDLPQDALRSRGKAEFEAWSHEDIKHLAIAVQESPHDSWNSLVGHIVRLYPQGSETEDDALELWLDGDRFERRRGLESVPNVLVTLAISAGKHAAVVDADVFWKATESLRCSDSAVVRFLLIETYADLPDRVADQGIAWILSDPTLLSVGTGENEPEWMPTARLISALSPHCNDDLFQQLEVTLQRYHSPSELRDAKYSLPCWKRGYYGDYWGRAQYFSLRALCSHRRSEDITGLIGVLERKFADYSERRFVRRSEPQGGTVTSTLAGALHRISDRSWLEIIQNHQLPRVRGRTRRYRDGYVEESSVFQFSRQLCGIAKRFPKRFGRLATQFPSGSPVEYKTAMLEAIKETQPQNIPESEKLTWQPVDTETIEKVLDSFGKENDGSYARQFCWLLFERPQDHWSESTLETLIEYATSHPSPEGDRPRRKKGGNSPDEPEVAVNDLETEALNCVRGVAAMAIGEQLQATPELVEFFRETIERLCTDPHPAVRVAAVRMCLSFLSVDEDFAISCFLRAASDDLRVAASRGAPYYFNVGMIRHREKFSPIITQMLKAEHDEVAEQGAMEVAARWLFHDCFSDEVKECIQGSVVHRRGLAKVAVDFSADSDYFDKCRVLIESLVEDDDAEVRNAVSRFARKPDVLSLPGGVDLMTVFVKSKAFLDDPSVLMYALREYAGSLLPFAEVLLTICDQFVGPLRESSRDPRKGGMHDVSQFQEILLRLYEQGNDAADLKIVNRCLDAWDALIEGRVGMTKELSRALG
ncbi:NACHT domain-containing protein [Lacipirellula sp.]|uniref:NACHT domain-containing protein n=1 Tax=Lacipirellula sp. TaxID=2691419 RepID=UPI003D0A45A4